MNDRALRHVNVGLGGPTNGVPREDGFNITVASEIMAILCLSRSIKDLKDKISRITIGYTQRSQASYSCRFKSGRCTCNDFKRCNKTKLSTIN